MVRPVVPASSSPPRGAGKAVPEPYGILDPGVVIDPFADSTAPSRHGPPRGGGPGYQPTATSSHCGLPWETKED